MRFHQSLDKNSPPPSLPAGSAWSGRSSSSPSTPCPPSSIPVLKRSQSALSWVRLSLNSTRQDSLKVREGDWLAWSVRNICIPGLLLSRSFLFCLMSVLTNYLYIASLKYLDCTVVTAIFATNASFVYLLSWVILHQQFVGIR